jgi:hypothetical protein
VADELAQLAYEASVRRLDKQEEVLGELRSRTGILLAASSLAVSVLGRPAADTGSAAFAALAVLAFAISMGASLFVLLPKRDLVFALVGPRVYEELFEFRHDMSEVYRRLAYDVDRFCDANDRKMQRFFRGVHIAVWALVLEVVFLLAAVSDTLA